MGKLSRLDAVNRIIRSANEYPVVSLSDDGVNDTNIAESVLDETNLQTQMEAQNCNTTVETRSPTTEGFILLSPDVLSVDAVEADSQRNVTLRGSGSNTRLFDIDNNTFVFDSSIRLKIVIGLPFEDLPTPVQFQVTDAAARIYQAVTVGDPAMDGMLREVAKQSRGLSRAEDIRQRDSSILKSINARAATRRWWSSGLSRSNW